jgi:hypothetical protein
MFLDLRTPVAMDLPRSHGPLLALVLTLASSRALAQESSPEANTRRRADELSYSAAGALTLGYGVGVFVWSTQLESCSAAPGSGCYLPSYWMLAPVVGPWIALTDAGLTPGFAATWVLSGVLQAAGLGLGIAGAALRASVPPVRPSVALAPGGAVVSVAGVF